MRAFKQAKHVTIICDQTHTHTHMNTRSRTFLFGHWALLLAKLRDCSFDLVVQHVLVVLRVIFSFIENGTRPNVFFCFQKLLYFNLTTKNYQQTMQNKFIIMNIIDRNFKFRIQFDTFIEP